MESQTMHSLEEKQRIERAAYWKSAVESEDKVDTTYKSFVQVMLYRRQIARNLLRESNEAKLAHLNEAFNYCNEQLKKILGL